jgi:hypothetical protein
MFQKVDYKLTRFGWCFHLEAVLYIAICIKNQKHISEQTAEHHIKRVLKNNVSLCNVLQSTVINIH